MAFLCSYSVEIDSIQLGCIDLFYFKEIHVDFGIFSKTEFKFVGRQAFASIKHGFFQVWGKCLPQAFPTPLGVTVLECPAISLDTDGFRYIDRCCCQLLIIMFKRMADVNANLLFCGRCFGHCCSCLMELKWGQMLWPWFFVTDVVVTFEVEFCLADVIANVEHLNCCKVTYHGWCYCHWVLLGWCCCLCVVLRLMLLSFCGRCCCLVADVIATCSVGWCYCQVVDVKSTHGCVADVIATGSMF